jgi:archaellum component FlaC
MARKIFAGIWLVLCGALFVLSLIGVVVVWKYRQPLTEGVTARLTNINRELAQAQSALQGAQSELERALRFVDSAEETLQGFSEQTAFVKELIDTVTEVLDETIKPNLATSREKIDEVQKTIDDLRDAINLLNRIPFVNLKPPDDNLLDSFVEIIDSLEGEITRVEDITDQASTFMDDTSYLMGGDLSETRGNIQKLQTVVDDYESRVGAWRGQIATLRAKSPGWILRASIALTVFLLWFALSQLSLFLHGLAFYRRETSWVRLRRPKA